MPGPKVTALPVGLTDAAQRERERFEAAYRALLDQVRQVSLSILVWGANPQSETAAGAKRRDIRDELTRRGHNAMFSEDIKPPGDIRPVSEKSKEYAQARAAHLIIILVEDAPGALAETHDFCNDPAIAPNVYVMIPSKYKNGYSAKGAIKDLDDAYGGVYWYKPNELTSCNVLTRAVMRAEARRHILHRVRGGAVG